VRLRIIGSDRTLKALRESREFGPLFTGAGGSDEASTPLMLRAALDHDDGTPDDLVPSLEAGDLGRWRTNLATGIMCGVVVHHIDDDQDVDRLVKWARRVRDFGREELQQDQRPKTCWDVIVCMTAELPGSRVHRAFQELHELSLFDGKAAWSGRMFRRFFLMTPRLRDASDGTPLEAKALWSRQVARLLAHLHLEAASGKWEDDQREDLAIHAWSASVLELRVQSDSNLRRAIEEALKPFDGRSRDPDSEDAAANAPRRENTGGGTNVPLQQVEHETLTAFAEAPGGYFSKQVEKRLGSINHTTGVIDWRGKNRERARKFGKDVADANADGDGGSNPHDTSVWQEVRDDPSSLWKHTHTADLDELKKDMEGANSAIDTMLREDRIFDEQWLGLAPKVDELDRARKNFVDLRWRLVAGLVVGSLLGTVTTMVLSNVGFGPLPSMLGGSGAGVVAIATAVASYFLERQSGDRGVSEIQARFNMFSKGADERIKARRDLTSDGRKIVGKMRHESAWHSTMLLKHRLMAMINFAYAGCMDRLADAPPDAGINPTLANEAIENWPINIPEEQQQKEEKQTVENWTTFSLKEDDTLSGRYRVSEVVHHVQRRFSDVLKTFLGCSVVTDVEPKLKPWAENRRKDRESGVLPALSVQTGLSHDLDHGKSLTKVWVSELLPVGRESLDEKFEQHRLSALATRVAALHVDWISVKWDDGERQWLELDGKS